MEWPDASDFGRHRHVRKSRWRARRPSGDKGDGKKTESSLPHL